MQRHLTEFGTPSFQIRKVSFLSPFTSSFLSRGSRFRHAAHQARRLQGSILRPILFTVYNADIPVHPTPNTQIFAHRNPSTL